MVNWIKKNPTLAYYLLTFGWTWIIVFILIASGQAENVNNPSFLFILLGLISNIAPSIVAFLVSRQAYGDTGVLKLKSQFKKSNPFKYYGLTAMIVPSITLLTILISNFTVRAYQVQVVFPMIILGLIWPLFSGFGEEFGWRGFILPQLLKKFTPIKAAIILGIIWEIWHIPMHYIAYKDYGVYMIPAFLLIGFINLTLQTIIMTFIYLKSQGSLKLMILYHYTITGSGIVFGGIFTTISTPRLVVLEAIISVALFGLFVIMLSRMKLHVKDDEKNQLST